MTPLLACTHVAAFLLGAAVCYRLVTRYGRRLDIHLSEAPMDETPPAHTHSEPTRSVRLIVVVLIASAFIIAIGIQARISQVHSDRADKATHAAQKRADHQRACTTRWANSFTDYYNGRLVVSAAVRDATVIRDNDTIAWQRAVGGIFSVFIVAVSPDKPPQHQLEVQFQTALDGFTAAEKALAKAQADLAEATQAAGAADPPPVLDLDCVLPKKGST